MKVEEIKEKMKTKIHICSKCTEELIWIDNICPNCGSNKFYPYYPKEDKSSFSKMEEI